MRKLTIATITLAAALAVAVQAQTQSERQAQKSQTIAMAQSEKAFIQQAAQANLAEIRLGKLGVKKCQNDQIRQFSQHLEADHLTANDQLRPIAKSKGEKIPRRLDSDRRQQISDLRKLSGAEFDRQFATVALQEHAKTIALFQREA